MQAATGGRRPRERGWGQRWRRWTGPDRAAHWRRGRARRVLAALLVAVAAWATLSALVPAPPPTTTVQVAARDLLPGAEVAPADVAEQSLPAELIPPGALRPGQAEAGSVTTVGPVAAGEVLTRSRVLLAGEAPVPPGSAGVFVPLPDPSLATVLAPGTPVDLVATADGSRLAAGARVLTVLRDAELGSVPGVLVGTTPPEAAAVAAAGTDPFGGSEVTLVLIGPDDG